MDSISCKDPNLRIKTAYLNIISATTNNIKALLISALAEAKKLGFDLFNVLAVGEVASILQETDFLEGDGILRYYLYNWFVDQIEPEKISITMM